MPKVSYLTDVEGNWEYFISSVKYAKGLRYVGLRDDGSAEIELEEGWCFVFGGDAVDKGGEVGGSIRVVKSLVDLKKRYPDRVTLVLGNRDVNKMRMTSELAPSQLERLKDVPGPYWVPEKSRVSPLKYLQEWVCDSKEKANIDDVSAKELQQANTARSRINWMLEKTMGAAGDFERRRNELKAITKQATVTDEAVVESYLESVRIGGCMHSLLRLGVLAALIDDVLYVHAGLVLEDGFKDGSTDCLGYVPGLPNRVPDVAEWVTKLNGWKDAQLDEWEARPEWDNPNTTLDSSDRGGHALMDYVVPGTLPSVIQSRHVDAKSMPMEMPEHLTRTLNEQNIFKMVVGHIPHGTCPTVIKSGGPGRNVPSMEIVMADTSYSDMSKPDNRGDALVEVVVNADGTAEVRGLLAADEEFEYTLAAGVGPSHELIGLLEDPPPGQPRRFVKAYLPAQHSYLLCRVDGFRYIYDTLPSELCREMLAPALADEPHANGDARHVGEDGGKGCEGGDGGDGGSGGEGGSFGSAVAARVSSAASGGGDGVGDDGTGKSNLLGFEGSRGGDKDSGKDSNAVSRESTKWSATFSVHRPQSEHRSSNDLAAASESVSKTLLHSCGDTACAPLAGYESSLSELVAHTFAEIDKDGTGQISKMELQDALRDNQAFLKLIGYTQDAAAEPAMADKLLEDMDSLGDGTIDKNEFHNYLMAVSHKKRRRVRRTFQSVFREVKPPPSAHLDEGSVVHILKSAKTISSLPVQTPIGSDQIVLEEQSPEKKEAETTWKASKSWRLDRLFRCCP